MKNLIIAGLFLFSGPSPYNIVGSATRVDKLQDMELKALTRSTLLVVTPTVPAGCDSKPPSNKVACRGVKNSLKACEKQFLKNYKYRVQLITIEEFDPEEYADTDKYRYVLFWDWGQRNNVTDMFGGETIISMGGVSAVLDRKAEQYSVMWSLNEINYFYNYRFAK